jgi:hypothetical protein
MARGEVSAPALRDLVIRVAREPNADNHALFCEALERAVVFVKFVGASEPGRGERQAMQAGAGVRMRHVVLPNGSQMLGASAAPPRSVAADETVATISAQALLRMVMQTPAQGLVVSAEDEGDSWTVITRDGIASILK